MAATLEKVKDAVSVVLPATISPDVQFEKATTTAFMNNALKDQETGEYYLDEERFIDTIAPQDADYACFFDSNPNSY
jgi:solute carrier family 25 (mitochondrial aspartate/glutamate transporter), member 12/13